MWLSSSSLSSVAVRFTLALYSLVSVSSYQLPRPLPLDQSGLGLSRREVAVVLIGGGVWSSSFGGVSNRAVAATPGFKAAQGYTSNGDTKFHLEVPSGWYVSQAKGARLNGVVLSAGDYSTGATVSVAETTVAALLEGPFAPSGPFNSFQDTYTKPLALADLLVRLRDGDLALREKTGASSALAAAWAHPAPSTRLALEAATLLSRGASGRAGFNPCLTAQATSRLGEAAVDANFGAPACDSEAAAAALRQSLETSAADRARRSRAVALLVPPPPGARPSAAQQQGRVLVLWASAPNAWQARSDGPDGSAVLEDVLASFEAEPAP